MPDSRRASFLIYLGIAVALGLIACVACFEIMSPDLFWHLRMGEDLVKHGLSPFADHYSFTYLNAPIKRNAWPFEVIIWTIYNLGGVGGIALFRFLIWASGLGLLLFIFQKQNIRWPLKILGTIFFLFICAYHSEPRPDLLSETFELLTLTLCFWWRETDSFKAIGALSLLFVFWSNYHVSSVLGYVIVGAFLIENLGKLVSERASMKLFLRFGFAALIVNLAGMLNHDFLHPIFSQAALSPKWLQYITEYATRPYLTEELYLEIYWILLALSLPALILKREWAGLIVSSVIGYKTWSMSKLFPHLIVLTLPFVCFGLNFYVDVLVRGQRRVAIKFLALSAAVMTGVLSWQLLNAAVLKPIHPLALRMNAVYFPVDTVDFFKAKNFKGRILNEYALGGYLLFRLTPDASIYIDGRTSVLYPLELMEHYMDLLTNIDPFKTEVQKYGVDWVIGSLEKPDELVDTALASGLFSLEYVGQNSALLSHSTAFRLSTATFLHPGCFEPADGERVREELRQAKEIMPARSPLVAFLELADKYYSSGNKDDLFKAADQSFLGNSYTTRLAAFLADREGKGASSLFYYGQIPHPTQDDKLNWAEADCKYNHCEKAESILDTVTASGLRDEHIYRAYKILEKIRAEGGLKTFSEERFQRDRAKVENYLKTGTVPSSVNWCNSAHSK